MAPSAIGAASSRLVLSLLLRARDEDGEAMTTPELRDELFTMLAAGHETTSTGLAFSFELLLRNPDVLARLREELAADDGDGDTKPSGPNDTVRVAVVVAVHGATVPRAGAQRASSARIAPITAR